MSKTLSYHLSSARTVYQLLQLSADGKTEEIKEMLDTGVDVNAVDYDKRTALHLAAAEGRFCTVKFLVERGGDVNAVDRFGGTPLRDALEGKRYDISSFLRLHGGTLGERSDFLIQKVLQAASEGNVLMLENVFENSFLSVDAADYDNRTPLHLAAACNHKKACEYLLKKGANPKALDRFGNTPIEEALREKHPEIAALLEKFDARVEETEEEESEDESEVESEEEEEQEEDMFSEDCEDHQLTPKEKSYQSAVLIFINSFFSHVLEETSQEVEHNNPDLEEEEDDFSLSEFSFKLPKSASPPTSPSSRRPPTHSPLTTLSGQVHILKDIYKQFRNKFSASRSPNCSLNASLRKKISQLSKYDRTTLNYCLLFNEQCVKTNFYDEEKDAIHYQFASNVFLGGGKGQGKEKGERERENLKKVLNGGGIQLQFDFS